MKTTKILFLTMLMIASCVSKEVIEMIPGASSDLTILDSYEAPYKSVGIFCNGKRLEGSITEAIDSSKILSHVVKLSNEHYGALKNRDLKIATEKASEMRDIWNGKYGFHKTKLSETQDKNFKQLKLRCLEQIEMSFQKSSADEIFANNKSILPIFTLARNLTNTPLYFQDISYHYSKTYGVKENAYLMIPMLEKIDETANQILHNVIEKYPDQKDNIIESYLIKSEAYLAYLTNVYHALESEKMSSYRAVDRGQTSAGHRNTCLFNSVFYSDCSKGNITSTKLGSIQKGKDYLTHLKSLYSQYDSKDGNPMFTLNRIGDKLNSLSRNRSIEASYGFESMVQGERIFPGVLTECSALEIQAHSLSANYIIFLKSRTLARGNNLLSYYGCGYLASENFPIIPVSCSLGHAQGLIKI